MPALTDPWFEAALYGNVLDAQWPSGQIAGI